MAQVIHWNLCGKLGFERDENYCNHEPKPVYESTNNKLLWDFKIHRLTTRLNTTSLTLRYGIR